MPKGATYSKPKSHGMNQLKPTRNLQSLAEVGGQRECLRSGVHPLVAIFLFKVSLLECHVECSPREGTSEIICVFVCVCVCVVMRNNAPFIGTAEKQNPYLTSQPPTKKNFHHFPCPNISLPIFILQL